MSTFSYRNTTSILDAYVREQEMESTDDGLNLEKINIKQKINITAYIPCFFKYVVLLGFHHRYLYCVQLLQHQLKLIQTSDAKRTVDPGTADVKGKGVLSSSSAIPDCSENSESEVIDR